MQHGDRLVVRHSTPAWWDRPVSDCGGAPPRHLLPGMGVADTLGMRSITCPRLHATRRRLTATWDRGALGALAADLLRTDAAPTSDRAEARLRRLLQTLTDPPPPPR